MMDWEDSSGRSSDDDTDYQTMAKDLRDAKDNANLMSTTRGSMRGLQKAIQEGWSIQRGRDLCAFAHDRYRQAAQAEAWNLPEGSIPKMSLRVRLIVWSSRRFKVTRDISCLLVFTSPLLQIILMMLHEDTPEVYRIAEHAKRYGPFNSAYALHVSYSVCLSRCLPLLREHPKRDELFELLIDAGDSARTRGAHEVRACVFLVKSNYVLMIVCLLGVIS